MKKTLIGLNPKDVLHPKDKSTLDTLNKIPGFNKLLKVTVADMMEKMAAIEYSGNGLNINKSSSPKLNLALNQAAKILDMDAVPAFSTEWHYAINAFSVGDQNKRLVLLSGAVDLLNEDELQFILGHELGHMKCNHMPYLMLTESLYTPITNSSTGNLILSTIKMPLMSWYRIADFTADRVGLLCCQDIKVALSTMIKMAGLPKSYYNQIDINSFILQARDFKMNFSSNLDKAMKFISNNGTFHPWLVLRASELLDWHESGSYNAIINKYGKYSI
jgi:Zn-dependent protease with chaperone function